MNPKIEELIKTLAESGMKKNEIIKVRDDLLLYVYKSFMSDAMKVLTGEDLQKIEALPTQEKANELLKKIYAEKTGKDAQEVMRKMVDEKVDELVVQYKKSSDAAPTPVEEQKAVEDPAPQVPPLPEDSHEAAKPSNWQ